jgi:SAM-dependent methyltransferase
VSLADRLFPGWRDARKELRRDRPAHFRLPAAVSPPPVPLLDDLPPAEIARINGRSEEYFQRPGMRGFWINKPFSEAAWTGLTLSRFGQLLSALDLRPGDRVLDFGCGTGWSTIMLARMGMDVVGMDISAAALDVAREGAASGLVPPGSPSPRFEPFPGDRLPYDDGHFDAIVVFDAFHHLPNPRRVLEEFCRVLAPNSRLGLAEPGVGHTASLHSQAEMEHGVLEREIDLEQLHRTALAAGFQGTEVLVPHLHPHAVTLPMRRLRWYLRGLSWLVPANHVRLAILHSPLVLVWKGPHFISSLHPRAQSASIRTGVPAVACAPGEPFGVAADVTNTATTAWLAEGRHGRGAVKLGAHLRTAAGELLEQDYGRAALPRDLRQGERVRLLLDLRAPLQPGEYVVQLDMVNEGIGWFAEGRSEVSDIALAVKPVALPA